MKYVCMLVAWMLFWTYVLFVGLPHFMTDWFQRPMFVEACALGRMDDATITFCNNAFERRKQLDQNGWRPLNSDSKE